MDTEKTEMETQEATSDEPVNTEPAPPLVEPEAPTNPTDDPQPEKPSPPATVKPKRIRKKKKPKDALAPKFAPSGYNFFMRECRPGIQERHPEDNIQEITKKVALEWGALSEEQKKPYLEKADAEKKRYAREMEEYKKIKKAEETETSPSKQAKTEETNATEQDTPRVTLPMTNEGKTNGNNSTTGGAVERVQSYNELLKKRTGDYDIPIFTDDFLEHNKALDSELRTLRKSQTDYEQQNSILEKHVENMQNGVDKLTGETIHLKETNRILTNYLGKLRLKLVESLSGLAQGASLDNIDEFMADLQSQVTLNSHGPASLNKAKDIIRKADLHIQLQ